MSSRFASRAALVALFVAVLPAALAAQAAQSSAAGKTLTVERIWSQPSLNGGLTRGLVWSPDGARLGFFQTSGSGRSAATELWVMDAANGEKKLLVGAEKLSSVLPRESAPATQATGLGRCSPASFFHRPPVRRAGRVNFGVTSLRLDQSW
jgi:hypothetical protein